MRKTFFSILLLLSLSIQACSSSQLPAPPSVSENVPATSQSTSLPPPSQTLPPSQTTTHTSEPTWTPLYSPTSPSDTPTPLPTLTTAPFLPTPTPPPGAITVANVSQLKLTARLGKGVANDVAWSPDGETIAVSSPFDIDFYDANTIDLLYVIEQGGDKIAYSPDGMLIAIENGSSLYILDIVSRRMILELPIHYHYVSELIFNPNNELIAVIGETECSFFISEYILQVWDLNKGELKFSHQDQGSEVNIAFSPDGQRLALGDINGTFVIDMKTGSISEKNQNYPYGVTFNPEGDLLAITESKNSSEVLVMDLDKNLVIRSFNNVDYEGFNFSPDGSKLIVDKDGNSQILDLEGDEVLGTIEGGYSKEIDAFDPNYSKFISTGYEGIVLMWDLKAVKVLNSIDYSSAVSDIVFLPVSIQNSLDNYHLVAGYYEGEVWLWDIFGHEIEKNLLEHGNRLNKVAISPNGKFLATASDDFFVRVWDIASHIEIKKIEVGGEFVEKVLFDLSGRKLLISAAGETQVLDTLTWEILFQEKTSMLEDAYFLRDDQIFAFSFSKKQFEVWDTQTNKKLKTYLLDDDFRGEFDVATISEDLNYLAIAANGPIIYVRDLRSDRIIHKLWSEGIRLCGDYLGWIGDLAFSPDANLLASVGASGNIYLWDLTTGDLRRILDVPYNSATTVAFSPDGRLLAAGSSDGAIYVWGVVP